MPDFAIPVLEGPRVRLEPLGAHHSAGMFELWRQPEVCEHSGPCVDARGEPIALPAASPRDSDRLLAYWLERARAGTGFRWAVLVATPGRFAGAVGFNALRPRAELAYHLVPRDWGAGFATEASRLAVAWAFDSGVDEIELFATPANGRSVALARRLGFEPRGPIRSGALRFALARSGGTVRAETD